MTLLTLTNLSLYQGQRQLCHNLNLTINPGEAWLILGQNGAGKSTLLATLSGGRKPDSGHILLQQQDIHTWPARARAQILAWLTQHDDYPFPLSVLEKVLTGCHPRLARWDWESAQDIELAQQLLAELDLAGLEQRNLATLSGGERRRVALATVLMQQAQLLLLDEPLSQLDVHHQQQTLALFNRQKAQGQSLMVVGHDPNHARAFASHALLLFGDGRWRAGEVADIINSQNLSELYQHPIRALHDESGVWYVPEVM